jgi:putative addiction module component (TIGR02574 family)
LVKINLAELLKLPPADRAEIAVALWDSLADNRNIQGLLPIDPDHAAELDRRAAAHEADPGSAVAWEDVRRDLYRSG